MKRKYLIIGAVILLIIILIPIAIYNIYLSGFDNVYPHGPPYPVDNPDPVFDIIGNITCLSDTITNNVTNFILIIYLIDNSSPINFSSGAISFGGEDILGCYALGDYTKYTAKWINSNEIVPDNMLEQAELLELNLTIPKRAQDFIFRRKGIELIISPSSSTAWYINIVLPPNIQPEMNLTYRKDRSHAPL